LSDFFGASLAGRKMPIPKEFKFSGADGRVFSNYLAPIIVEENGERLIQDMRYRVRPAGSLTEIPNKFNVFNARLDSLETRQTWMPLFLKRHGLVPMTGFFEWVEDEKQKKKLIKFLPEGRDFMWAPVLWDEWISPDKKTAFRSFAIITDDPPEEILKMGHDRCPIFLRENEINHWLNPKELTIKSAYEILSHREDVYYAYQWQ
jgi:putative SOS response-associated peptidase YedK